MPIQVPQVRWKLELDGEQEELRGLSKMFAPCDAPGLRVWFDEEKCYLHAPDFEALADATAVHDRGELLVRRLNGLGLLKFGSFRPVTAGSVRGPGAGSITVFPGTATLYLPSRALLAYLDYTPRRPPAMNATVGPIALPPTEHWADAGDRYAPDVDDALLLLTLAAASEDWRLLYVVFEIVEDHVGKRSKLLRDRKSKIDRFKHTANSRRALGTKARHGHRRHLPPRRPMTFGEARKLVEDLLREWLHSIAESPAP